MALFSDRGSTPLASIKVQSLGRMAGALCFNRGLGGVERTRRVRPRTGSGCGRWSCSVPADEHGIEIDRCALLRRNGFASRYEWDFDTPLASTIPIRKDTVIGVFFAFSYLWRLECMCVIWF